MREKLVTLRQQCSALAVEVAAQVVENDDRRSQHERLSLPKEKLERLRQALYQPNGAMDRAVFAATDSVRKLRFQWALQAFSMFRLSVEKEENGPTQRQRHARGIAKIGGLPLPNAGPELYGVLPKNELLSALRLVAGLTCTLSRCLGIDLPHPILLQPHGPNGDIIDSGTMENQSRKEKFGYTNEVESASPESTKTAALLSLMDTKTWGRSAKTALQRATGAPILPPPVFIDQPPSMDCSAVSNRLLHAKAAVIAESSTSSARFALIPSSNSDDEHFAIGLQLLQNNIIALCIRVGVPVSTLWPAGAMLLNLHALRLFCQQLILQEDDA
jgi:hypothetical protein